MRTMGIFKDKQGGSDVIVPLAHIEDILDGIAALERRITDIENNLFDIRELIVKRNEQDKFADYKNADGLFTTKRKGI
jgi:hypothetical protein